MTKSLNDLTIDLYADGADKAGILELYAKPYIKGLTTNPSLMKKAGIKDYLAFYPNKIDIRRAVETLFKVAVTDVRTLIVRGKTKRVGKYSGRRPAWKKAFVTLKPGDNIEFFEGV